MIHFITGGERSGKSRHAQQLALSLTQTPVYVATARKWDEDFSKRIERHQQERDARWTNLEEEKYLSQLDLFGKVAVIDCVTLWLTNLFADTCYDLTLSLAHAKEEIDRLATLEATLVIISNEIGMGLHATTESGRKFVELQGWTNQHLAALSETVTFMVSGIPLKVK
jgi:adenosylcobinamide kinase/adenosylcobinamide-phosphate guanylyltransferase